jgi:UDP-glucose 4-epimerase
MLDVSEAEKTPRVLVTGCAGFIGSNLVDSLLIQGFDVIGLDNLTTGKSEFMNSALKNRRFHFYNVDLLKYENLENYFTNCDLVYHLSANADVRFGADHPNIDLEQNTLVTFRVLEAMRNSGTKKIMFSSTGSVYGESKTFPTPENAPFPIQNSLYGASKIASEALITSFCEAFEMQAWIFRFVSILGPRYSHGHVFDFMRQLLENPHELLVLGDGFQKKSYLHISDCIKGIEIGLAKSNEKINIFNLGVEDVCKVRDSVKWICERMQVDPKVLYGDQDRGWVGDNPFILLNTEKIRNLGWAPSYSIKAGILDTVDYILNNEIISNSIKASKID